MPSALKRAVRSSTHSGGVRWSGSGIPASLRHSASPRALRRCQAMTRSADSCRPEDADQAADQCVWQAGLDPGAGVCARQAADAERDSGGPVWRHGAVLVDRQDGEGQDACHRGHERRCQRGGGGFCWRTAGSDQDGREDRAAAEAHGACVRPIQIRRIDQHTGAEEQILSPSGAVRGASQARGG